MAVIADDATSITSTNASRILAGAFCAEGLDLGKRIFDRVVIRRVGRQVGELAALLPVMALSSGSAADPDLIS